jgi:antitoxin component YwqK of YwqJK toxin-antitoxin module
MHNWLARLGVLAASAAAVMACCDASLAQDDETTESVKIQPYTGPPIFLEEPEVVVEPSIVRRQTDKDEKGGIEREIALFSDNHIEADGAYRETYPNGKLFVEGQFRRGRQHGEWIYYFDNGQLNRKATYKDGKPDGPREVFREDGTRWAKRTFKEGMRDGEWITYDKSGEKPIAEEHYDNGKPDGIWKFWYPNGQQRQQLSLKQGKKHGLSIEWDDKGVKRFEATFADDKLHGTLTRWFADGRVIEQKFDEGKLVSQSIR